MKLGKTKLLILPLLLTSAVIPFTACSTGKPYQNVTPGDKIVGLNHKNVSYLKADVINQCDFYGAATITSTQFSTYLYDYASSGAETKVSSLMYWEIIWGMCQQESGELDLVQGESWTTNFPSSIKSVGYEFKTTNETVITIGNIALPKDGISYPYTFMFSLAKATDDSIDCVIKDKTQTITYITWKSRFFLNTIVTD